MWYQIKYWRSKRVMQKAVIYNNYEPFKDDDVVIYEVKFFWNENDLLEYTTGFETTFLELNLTKKGFFICLWEEIKYLAMRYFNLFFKGREEELQAIRRLVKEGYSYEDAIKEVLNKKNICN